MKILLDTSEDLDTCAKELDWKDVGQLLTPLTRRKDLGVQYGIDNGAFGGSGFNAESFLSLLKRQDLQRNRCLFVAVPDVVGSARRTGEVFKHWFCKLHGWPLALVAQDGIERLDIPWDLISAIFIGGSTPFKVGPEAEAVIRAAQAMGKYVHVGRVNTPMRFDKFVALGVDSIDGTGISRYSHMRKELIEGTPLLRDAG